MRTDIPILRPDRIRHRHGSFGWIEHRFIREGFLESLRYPESLLYVFLAIVADERGISFYSPERIRQLLGIPHAHTLQGAIDELVDRDLLAHQSGIYQVLDLPVSAGLYDRSHDRPILGRRHIPSTTG
ncbi:MAG: hypothetical protein JW704_00705 [Anaerolineaceae bacterium]|nr:hypothetical protein [Anaerolineaceae bacterium]